MLKVVCGAGGDGESRDLALNTLTTVRAKCTTGAGFMAALGVDSRAINKGRARVQKQVAGGGVR